MSFAAKKSSRAKHDVSGIVSLGERFKALADRRRLKEASELLAAFLPKDKVEERVLFHYQAQMLTYQNRWQESLELLERIQASHGDHLRLLADIGRCRYMLGDVTGWRKAVVDLEDAFKNFQPVVSEDTFIRAAFSLGFFFEEEGRMNEALALYGEVLGKAKELPFLYLRALIQVVRIQSGSGLTQALSQAYLELLRLTESNSSDALYIEAQHALVLAEVATVGVDKARERLENFLKNESLSANDRRLAYFDFLETSFLLGHGDLTESIPSAITPIAEDTYELALLAAIKSPEIGLKQLDIWVTQLPFAGYLRVLSVLSLRHKNTTLGKSARQQLGILLNALDTPSQKFWLSRLAQIFSDDVRVEVIEGVKEIRVGDRSISFTKKPTLWKLALCLTNRTREISVELVTEEIWGEAVSENNFQRLRMNVQELNKILLNLTSTSKSLKLTKSNLVIAPRVSFLLNK